jgi:CheY-like chemotaxis protein
MKGPADLKILTVDDDEEIRSTLSMLLECEGFQTVHAKNGRVAMDYLLRTSERELPDLILLDYMMPVMSGDDFCKMIAVEKKLKHIPVVMMTASGNLVKLMDQVEKKADGYLSKPMDIYSVLSMIEYFLKPHSHFQSGVSPSGLAH